MSSRGKTIREPECKVSALEQVAGDHCDVLRVSQNMISVQSIAIANFVWNCQDVYQLVDNIFHIGVEFKSRVVVWRNNRAPSRLLQSSQLTFSEQYPRVQDGVRLVGCTVSRPACSCLP